MNMRIYKMAVSLLIWGTIALMGPQSLWAQNIIYVNASASGVDTGTSWTDAYTDLQDALAEAVDVDQIWVAQGEYKPHPADRTVSFHLKNGVEFYGGFPNTGNPGMNERDWETFQTILGFTDLQDDYRSYHIIYNENLDSSTLLDGFVITGGNGSTPQANTYAGIGMYNSSSSLTIRNCIFTKNLAGKAGGAVYNSGGAPTFINCRFSNNGVHRWSREGSTAHGGAVYNANSDASFINCTFDGNVASDGWSLRAAYGGAVYNNSGDLSGPSFKNCTFTNNYVDSIDGTDGHGGAVYNVGYSTFEECRFTSNYVTNGNGGAIYNSGSSYYSATMILTNTVFKDNMARNDDDNGDDGHGGGIFNDSGDISLIACHFSGNTAEINGGAVYMREGGEVVLVNGLLVNNLAQYGGGIFNDNSSPSIINSTFYTNRAYYGASIFNYEMSRPTIANSILWGRYGGYSEILNDILALPSVSYCLIDGGYQDGSQILTDDPLFVNPIEDFHLQASSPAINAGDNLKIPAGITEDLDGVTRIHDGIVDMGAYEFRTETEETGYILWTK